MNAVIRPTYEFMRGENGIFVEIYLPKKAEFQGTLYDTLTRGFKIKNVQEHFNNSKKKPGITRLLKNYKDSIQFLGTRDEVLNFPPVFQGYSMYEVEGVFYNSKKKQIQGELTQIVRIMFRPDFTELLKKYKQEKNSPTIISRTIKDYLHYPDGREAFKKARDLTPMQIAVVDHWATWANYVGLFVFGYVIYKICEQIIQLCSNGEMQWNDAEDEIWVTSFWNLKINPIKKLKLPKRLSSS